MSVTAAVALCLACVANAADEKPAPQAPQLVSVTKIWDRAPHSAFTDLTRFKDAWFCVFREAEDHVGGDGCIRVLRSTDGEVWESAALVCEEGIDLRDPKLSITPDGRLMIVAGGSVYQGTRERKGAQPRVAFSADGSTWSAPQRVVSPNEWLWRVTWHKGTAYGVAYAVPAHGEDAEEVRGRPPRLYSSKDGVDYKLVAELEISDWPNETTLRFLSDDRMVALVRRENGDRTGLIGVSEPPYTEWKWNSAGHRLGGPDFIVLPDGKMWAGSRAYEGGAKTALARMTLDSYEPVLTLPSGGDNSYPGFVWHDGELWMSYYSSHEGKSSIYLARIKLAEE